ncbi:MAG: ABC transporter permease [Pseudomonadota bacterium]|nr:ABC transporter permease [Pseudomonadota bacterium]|tara:strand:- start:854 stop:1630 length:777 start_codon:yes stop_codon:yes gene_type:complete
MIKRFLSFLAPIFTFILLLCSWELVVSFQNIPKYILPAPTDIFSSILLNYEDLLLSTFITFRITILAFLVASFLAIFIAILFSQSKIIELSLYPIAVIFQVTPVVAIAPLILIWVGLDNAEYAILILAIIVAFFPVLANTNLGIRSVEKNLSELFSLYEATRFKRLFKLQLPYALPFILTGMKTSIGLALIGAVVAEFVAGSGTSTGLAWRIIEAGNRLDVPKLFAALILLVVLGIVLFLLMSLIEKLLLRRWDFDKN